MQVPRGVRVTLRWLALVSVLSGVRCAQDTSRLTPEQEARFQEEGIVRRADNIDFHYTHDYRSGGSYGGIRENREVRRASIIVTHRTVLLHKNEKVGIQITGRTRRYDVHRREGRVLIRAGTGATSEVWSFTPPDDPEGWTHDIRAVIRAGADPDSGAAPTRRGRSRRSRG